MLGAYLADVLYSRPVAITAVASDASLLDRHGLEGSRYEGPTGVVGMLGYMLKQKGVDFLALWAGLPHYIHVTPNPRGALALLERAEPILDLKLDLDPLRTAAQGMRRADVPDRLRRPRTRRIRPRTETPRVRPVTAPATPPARSRMVSNNALPGRGGTQGPARSSAGAVNPVAPLPQACVDGCPREGRRIAQHAAGLRTSHTEHAPRMSEHGTLCPPAPGKQR